MLTRPTHSRSSPLRWTIYVNLVRATVEINGSLLHLTGKEYQVLELLAIRKGSTLTKEMFLNHLYDGLDEPEAKIVDVFICKLRKKLANASGGKDYIETVWGRGFAMREAAGRSRRLAASPRKFVETFVDEDELLRAESGVA